MASFWIGNILPGESPEIPLYVELCSADIQTPNQQRWKLSLHTINLLVQYHKNVFCAHLLEYYVEWPEKFKRLLQKDWNFLRNTWQDPGRDVVVQSMQTRFEKGIRSLCFEDGVGLENNCKEGIEYHFQLPPTFHHAAAYNLLSQAAYAMVWRGHDRYGLGSQRWHSSH